MLAWFRKSMRTGCVTKTIAPETAGRDNRYSFRLASARCDKCGACANACPTKAIAIEQTGKWSLDYKKCIFCLHCIESCHSQAISATANTMLTIKNKKALAASLRHVFGRFAHIRHVDSGSCNACDWEMNALLNPIYDLQQYGFDFVASPRHADILLVTGAPPRTSRRPCAPLLLLHLLQNWW